MSLFSVSSSTAVSLKPLSAPFTADCSDNREPLVSVMMDAVTPALAALILSRTEARLSSPAMMLMTTSDEPALGVKPDRSGAQVPTLSVSEPVPTKAAELANCPEALTSVWPADSDCTAMA